MNSHWLPRWRIVQPMLGALIICTVAIVVPVYAASPSITTSAQPPPETASTSSIDTMQSVQKEYQSISRNGIEQAWNNLQSEYGGYLPTTNSGIVPSFLPGGSGFSFQDVAQGLLRFLINSLWSNARLLGTLLILTVLAAVLENVQTAFESQTVSKVAFLVIHLTLLIMAISSFHDATQFAGSAIDNMTAVMFGSLPVVLALVTASGGLTSAAVFHPMVIFVVNAMSVIVQKWVFPMIFFAAVLTIVSAISGKFKVIALAGLIRNVTLTVLGLSMTAFLGVMAVQGSLASVTDGVALRSAKFVAGSLIPVVGKALSDATQSIAGATLLVKNATGVASAILLLLISAFPAIKVLVLSMVYNGAAALMQPLGDSPVITTLSTIGKTLAIVFAALAVVGVMFFFSMVIIIVATNVTAFVR